MSTSRPYHHGDLRSALLATTRELLAEVGIEHLSLREVSRRTGVSHAAAYNHFSDKASLMSALVDAAFAQLAAHMQGACRRSADPLERLKRIGVAYVVFAYRNPVDFKLMFRPELCATTDDTASVHHEGAFGMLVQTIAECQRAGVIAAGPSEPLVLAAWSMVHGLSSLIVDGPNSRLAPTLAVAESLGQQCVELLIAGLARPSAPAKRRVANDRR